MQRTCARSIEGVEPAPALMASGKAKCPRCGRWTRPDALLDPRLKFRLLFEQRTWAKTAVVTEGGEMKSIGDEEIIRQKSLARIANVFSISADGVSLSDRFGVELKPSFVSDFKDNELDVINNDIHDVASRKEVADLDSGKLVITTVGDYCDFMVRCSRSNPSEVAYLLKMA